MLSGSLAAGLVWVVSVAVPAAGPAGEPRCKMSPYRDHILIPAEDLVWLEGEEFEGPCEPVPDGGWESAPGGKGGLEIYLDGPAGSGRFWDVTVRLASDDPSAPSRGFCLTTSTVGWRTLWQFPRTPLPWLEDLNEDGKPELIVWDSFPLRESAPMSDYGLVAWAYVRVSEDRFELDWDLSRELATMIAVAYRAPLDGSPDWIRTRRQWAIADLEAFAAARCTSGATLAPPP